MTGTAPPTRIVSPVGASTTTMRTWFQSPTTRLRHAARSFAAFRWAALSRAARRWNALVYVSAGERTQPELSGGSVAVAGPVVFGLSALAPSTRLGRLERV